MNLILFLLISTPIEDPKINYGGCNTDSNCEQSIGYEDAEMQEVIK